MSVMSRSSKLVFLTAALAGTVSFGLAAQAQEAGQADVAATVDGERPAEGPEVKGIITARNGEQLQITAEDGSNTIVSVDDTTRIRGRGGFLGLGSNKLASQSLLNGLPVTIKTWQSGGGLLAKDINLQNKDLKTATMIRGGTAQGFAEQTAATEALRGRMADIDQYNIKGTTNVNFASGKAVLSPQAKSDLCATATQAEGMKNALLLVVGYTDSTGSPEVNQVLSEKRAGNVVNYLQQACGWKPYRMLSPTGMSEADPLADNNTRDGKAQNRRVAVNIMVSKGLDGL